MATLSRTKTAFIARLLRRPRAKNFCWSAVDARDDEALRGFVTEIIERFGRIDVLVNNLGMAVEGVLPTMRASDIVEAVQVNLTAALVLSQACSRAMLRQGGGCIVNISSVNAVRGHAGVAVYSAAKAGLDGLTRSLARELGPRNIRVNSVAPGYFESEMVKGMTDEQKQRIVRRTPLGRLARAEDVANAVYFLASATGILHYRADPYRGRRNHMLKPGTPEQIEAVVHDRICRVLQQRSGQVHALGGTDKLNATLGLSSLDLAFLVAELEAELGVDPFAKLVSITSIRSVDDLVRAYRGAILGGDKLQAQESDLAAAMQRANNRRARRARK